MVTSFWKNYDAKSAYDGYLTEDNKLRKHARIMSGILETHGKKKWKPQYHTHHIPPTIHNTTAQTVHTYVTTF